MTLGDVEGVDLLADAGAGPRVGGGEVPSLITGGLQQWWGGVCVLNDDHYFHNSRRAVKTHRGA